MHQAQRAHDTLTPRGRLVHRLQWVSLFLSWTVFIVSIATGLGARSLWITMSAGILTWALEGPLLWRGRNNDSSRKDAPASGSTHSSLESAANANPGTLALACHLPFLIFRIVLVFIWAGGIAMMVYLTLLQSFSFVVGSVVEGAFAVGEIGVLIALLVLCFRERASRNRSGGKEGAWFDNGQYR